MIKQTDLPARLRLLRYGLLVVVLVTFAVSISYPIVALQDRGKLGDFLVQSLIFTAVVAVICVVIYFAYDYILHRTMGSQGQSSEPKTEG